jgi:TonB-linked SusC/RagA family outer membrane protein
MKRTTLTIVMATLCLFFKVNAQHPTRLIGRVISSANSTPLAGATITIKNTKISTQTDKNGKFDISTPNSRGDLIISFTGYKTKEISFSAASTEPYEVTLTEDEGNLKEVAIVSTGYQNIPKERATGSFVLIDSTLLSQRVTTNILDRLDGVTSGLIFNRNLNNQANNASISIRGRSTLFANPNPLIVLDNFPYDGDLENINPNDIENISVLKDAAAASIWGVRAGNGVIIITTKKGKRNAGPMVSITSNLKMTNKIDLKNQPWMSSGDFIGLEEFLFNKGAYNSAVRRKFTPISPAVQVFADKRNNVISSADSARLINQLKAIDARDQWSKYFYQPAFEQQHQLSISGGGPKQIYFISAGYDRNKESLVNNSFERLTLNANNTYYLIKDKLEIYSGINLTNSLSSTSSNVYQPFTPYDLVSGESGEALEIGTYLNPAYTDTVGKGLLTDWKYKPLNELDKDRTNRLMDYRANIRLSYEIISGLKLSLNYQYQRGINTLLIDHGFDSFYTRNLTNTYSSINSGNVLGPIAPGAILIRGDQQYRSHNGRVQFDFNRDFSNGRLSLSGGAEVKDFHSEDNSQTIYGYDETTGANGNARINATALYKNYYNLSESKILTSPSQNLSDDRYRSYYLIGSYSYRDKYTLSGSFREDQSNLFGVKANQKGVPLWSVGGKYDLSKASFYKASWLPVLSFRVTFGYNGNVDKSTSAYLTSAITAPNPWGQQAAEVINPPNPSLRWEKVQNLNTGIDFGLKNSFMTGSIDFFVKTGKDLIGYSPIVPQTGISIFKGNSADTRTKGVDATIRVNWLKGRLSWNTSFLASYSSEMVTRYRLARSRNAVLIGSNYSNPVEGYPYHAIFSYRYAGLDAKGNPIGYVKGEPSQDYAAIVSSYNMADLVYHGSAIPLIYGGVLNTVSWKGIRFSFNVTYKLNYYYRQKSVFSGDRYEFLQTGYDQRWQQPGDELTTNIPALIYPANNNRSALFSQSEVLVKRADHIRLQYLQLSCPISRIFKGKKWLDGSVYFGMTDIGILWKKSKGNIDPDYGYNKMPLSSSIGVKFNIY